MRWRPGRPDRWLAAAGQARRCGAQVVDACAAVGADRSEVGAERCRLDPTAPASWSSGEEAGSRSSSGWAKPVRGSRIWARQGTPASAWGVHGHGGLPVSVTARENLRERRNEVRGEEEMEREGRSGGAGAVGSRRWSRCGRRSGRPCVGLLDREREKRGGDGGTAWCRGADGADRLGGGRGRAWRWLGPERRQATGAVVGACARTHARWSTGAEAALGRGLPPLPE